MPVVFTNSPMASSGLSRIPCSSNSARGHTSPVSGFITTTPGATPSAPLGWSGHPLIVMPISVEPKASSTSRPKRLLNFSTSSSLASFPIPVLSRLSASSGHSGVARMYSSGLPT